MSVRAAALTLALAFSLTSTASAQSLTTLPANNGTGGVFLTLTAGATPLEFTGFSTYFGNTGAGTPANVEVWFRPGAYAGFTAANTGWTLSETVTGFAAGTAVESALITLTIPITLPAGSPVSIYLHSTTAGNGIRYQGTGTASTGNFSNADLTLFSDIARTGTVSFAGTQFTPRAFAGTINYTGGAVAVPEPSTVLAGLAAVGLVWLRRRSRNSQG